MTVNASLIRHDLVLIRKSTDSQANKEQESNVKRMLARIGVNVPDMYWRYFTLGRRKVLNSDQFEPIFNEVRTGQIGTIYVESQDRFGGKSNKELFSVLHELQKYGTRLYDLNNKRDLTSDELPDELQALIDGNKSQKELLDIASRSLRSRINRFYETGSWPTGTAPFGFGKACYNSSNKKRWEWHPTKSRAIGNTYNSDGSIRESDVKIPRKERSDTIKLVPNRNKSIVEAVRATFRYFVYEGLSRRQIAIRLKQRGSSYYGKPFTFSIVSEILKNPAHVGDTAFGKSQTGELFTFNEDLTTTRIDNNPKAKLELSGREAILKENTHTPLIERKTWERAQDRLIRELKRNSSEGASLPPRKSIFYLKGILVCGHCGKRMIGRSDSSRVKYVCSSYSTGGSNGIKSACGFHTINHDMAEKIIFNRLQQFDLDHQAIVGGKGRSDLELQILGLEAGEEEALENFKNTVEQGVAALIDYFKAHYQFETSKISKLEKLARRFYRYGKFNIGVRRSSAMPMDLAKLKSIITNAEEASITIAKKELKLLNERHRKLTDSWVDATDMQKVIMKQEIVKLEAQINDCENQCQPISNRLKSYWQDSKNLRDERNTLISEWEGVDDRIKGEALRRIIDKVELFWEKEWHESEKKPSRPRKTNRTGRWRYHLQEDKIRFVLRDLDLQGSW